MLQEALKRKEWRYLWDNFHIFLINRFPVIEFWSRHKFWNFLSSQKVDPTLFMFWHIKNYNNRNIFTYVVDNMIKIILI